jgi:MFS superfamily sulfate permease-like transporter
VLLIDEGAWGAAAATIGVIALGVLNALAIAVALSIVDVVRRSAEPHDAVLGWDDRLRPLRELPGAPGPRG